MHKTRRFYYGMLCGQWAGFIVVDSKFDQIKNNDPEKFIDGVPQSNGFHGHNTNTSINLVIDESSHKKFKINVLSDGRQAILVPGLLIRLLHGSLDESAEMPP